MPITSGFRASVLYFFYVSLVFSIALFFGMANFSEALIVSREHAAMLGHDIAVSAKLASTTAGRVLVWLPPLVGICDYTVEVFNGEVLVNVQGYPVLGFTESTQVRVRAPLVVSGSTLYPNKLYVLEGNVGGVTWAREWYFDELPAPLNGYLYLRGWRS